MAIFNDAVITNLGKETVKNILTAGNELNFSGLIIGTGIYTELEKSKEEIEKMTSLKMYLAKYPIDNISFENNVIKLQTAITNIDFTEDESVTEIGILADYNGEEILFCVAVSQRALSIPKYDGSYAYTIMHESFVSLSSEINIAIKKREGAYALQEEVDKEFNKIKMVVKNSAVGRETEPQTLTAGQTTLTFVLDEIKENDRIEILASTPDVGYEALEVSGNSITVTFEAMTKDIMVKVVVCNELV